MDSLLKFTVAFHYQFLVQMITIDEKRRLFIDFVSHYNDSILQCHWQTHIIIVEHIEDSFHDYIILGLHV